MRGGGVSTPRPRVLSRGRRTYPRRPLDAEARAGSISSRSSAGRWCRRRAGGRSPAPWRAPSSTTFARLHDVRNPVRHAAQEGQLVVMNTMSAPPPPGAALSGHGIWALGGHIQRTRWATTFRPEGSSGGRRAMGPPARSPQPGFTLDTAERHHGDLVHGSSPPAPLITLVEERPATYRCRSRAPVHPERLGENRGGCACRSSAYVGVLGDTIWTLW